MGRRLGVFGVSGLSLTATALGRGGALHLGEGRHEGETDGPGLAFRERMALRKYEAPEVDEAMALNGTVRYATLEDQSDYDED